MSAIHKLTILAPERFNGTGEITHTLCSRIHTPYLQHIHICTTRIRCICLHIYMYIFGCIFTYGGTVGTGPFQLVPRSFIPRPLDDGTARPLISTVKALPFTLYTPHIYVYIYILPNNIYTYIYITHIYIQRTSDELNGPIDMYVEI